jgi:ADP-L-glycero-D-manno-heptose 6-epimerase
MIVVTGGAGFIGSNLVAELNERGRNDIVVSDWLREDQRWLNLRKRMFRDFVFPEDLIAFCGRNRPDAILHMGANSSTTAVNGDDVLKVNTKFTLALVDYCAAFGVPLIYASSAATYGDGDSGFDDDSSLASLRKLRPLNLYGWSKHLVDLALAERREQGLALPPKCIGLKFFNVYGQNEYHKGDMVSVVGKSFAKVSAGGGVELFKSQKTGIEDGGQRRDFIYIDDVVDVTLWCLEKGPAFGLFNVGTGVAQSFRGLIEALFLACNREPQINYIPMPEFLRERYQYFTQANMTKLRYAGYDGQFAPVERGVENYVHFLASSDPYR